jgi:hypothetical protein
LRNYNAPFPEEDACVPKHLGNIYLMYLEGKTFPFQVWTGQDVSKELRFQIS